jgi:hypothetical protein
MCFASGFCSESLLEAGTGLCNSRPVSRIQPPSLIQPQWPDTGPGSVRMLGIPQSWHDMGILCLGYYSMARTRC